jgi:GntR family transcriptional regulator of vanillate catabolism
VRAVLEGLACRIVAEAGLPKATEEVLRGCIATGEALVADPDSAFDHGRWREMNVVFHNAILDAADNDTLLSAARHAEKVPLATMSVIADWAASPDYTLMRMAHIDHCYILNALRAGAGARAEARMREHITVASDLLVERIEKQQIDQAGPS